jgi:hypothetical protein
MRGYLVRKVNKLKGEGLMKRGKCVNQMDFLLLNQIRDVPYNQFISYTDDEGFVYGFDICSLWNLRKERARGEKEILNPFNRKAIPSQLWKSVVSLKRLSKVLLNKVINVEINVEIENLSDNKKLELKTLTLFQKIDAFGYITDISWFMSLKKMDLFYLLRELIDIWRWRAKLTEGIKKNIYPPTGNPFSTVNWDYFKGLNEINLKYKILKIFENLVENGVDEGSRQLGALYVLGAITMAHKEAADALPWLYESFYIQ